jgi:hypothetical protein
VFLPIALRMIFSRRGGAWGGGLHGAAHRAAPAFGVCGVINTGDPK